LTIELADKKEELIDKPEEFKKYVLEKSKTA